MGFKRADPHIDDVYPIMDPLVRSRDYDEDEGNDSRLVVVEQKRRWSLPVDRPE